MCESEEGQASPGSLTKNATAQLGFPAPVAPNWERALEVTGRKQGCSNFLNYKTAECVVSAWTHESARHPCTGCAFVHLIRMFRKRSCRHIPTCLSPSWSR